jgi:hypothetical protein
MQWTLYAYSVHLRRYKIHAKKSTVSRFLAQEFQPIDISTKSGNQMGSFDREHDHTRPNSSWKSQSNWGTRKNYSAPILCHNWSAQTPILNITYTRKNHSTSQNSQIRLTMAGFQHLPRFRVILTYYVTVVTHAELFDKKNKSRLFHDVMPQGRGGGGMHLKVPSIFRANSQSSHSYRALGRRKQFDNTLTTHEGNKKHVEILVGIS